MSLKTKVKVGNVNNLSEARYCAAMGVDMLGFPVGKDGLGPDHYKQIIEWISGPELILETIVHEASDKAYITENYPAHYIQIGKNQLGWLTDTTLTFIVAIHSSEWDQLKSQLFGRKNIRFVELEVDSLQDPAIESAHSHFPLLIDFKGTTDIQELLRLPIEGIALKGSSEEKPGMKEYQLAEILESLEID